MSWQLAVFSLLALVLISGFVWFERSRPSARILAAVAALAALGVAGRVALAPIPNVVATTDVALLAGYTLGGPPGFAVGGLSALISNFWLGQGPWTPWQMAGWGMVGIGGAALAAVAGRRLGRYGLALAAGLAGLLYGALLDLSVMVNFGGEQSLDRYLALSARGIPFNIAHALGNAALMLAAGPALVRMLDRYRDRFQFRWSRPPETPPGDGTSSGERRRGPRAAGAGAATLLIALVAFALLAAAPERVEASPAEGRSWLVGAQNKDGGYGTDRRAPSSTGMTGWAILGLEAAGRNPLDVRSSGKTPIDFLRRNVGALDSTADLERTILGLEAAGIGSRSFGGRNLLGDLRGRRRSSGSFEAQVNLTAFAVLAQRSAGVKGGALGRSAAWLRKAQNRDGGWGSTANGRSDSDSTGAVLQALAVAPGGSGESADGVRWLERAQRGDGSWTLSRGLPGNSQSTAWAIQGLVAAGRNPGGVTSKGDSGLDYLATRQSGDGHYRYSGSSDQTPVWVTAQALTALGRAPFPLAKVDRAPRKGSSSSGDGSGSFSGSGGTGRGSAPADKRAGKGRGGERGGLGGVSGSGPKIDEDGLPEIDPEQLAAAAGSSGEGGLSAPPTAVLLGGLVGLVAILAAGGLVLRRRLRSSR